MKSVELYVQAISDDNDLKIISDCTLKNKLIYVKLIKSSNLSIIEKDTLLFRELSEQDSTAEKVSPENLLQANLNLKNIRHNLHENTYASEEDGILLLKDQELVFIPVFRDAKYNTIVSEDNLRVYINLYPSYKDGIELSVDEIVNDLRAQNIKCFIDEYLLRETLKSIESEKKYVENLLIAEGKKPIDGTDSQIEYLIDITTDFKPHLTEDGRVDFYHLHITNSVDQDTALAKFVPHKDETNGEDVYGKIIQARKPQILKFPAGKNTYTDINNTNLIRAAREGNVIIKNEMIEVQDLSTINGNVDFSTGSIKSKGSILVKGNVLSGFEVDMEDNIEILGYVEDAKLTAGGNVKVNGGFLGKGTGEIRAKGNVDIKYIHNQKIYSRETINVCNEVMSANLYALKKILIVGGKEMAVFGGHLIAGDYIEANSFGNIYSVATLIEAGFDYEHKEIMDKNLAEINSYENQLSELKKNYDQLLQYIHLALEHKKTLHMLVEQRYSIYSKIDKFDENQEQLKKINTVINNFLNMSHLDIIHKRQFLTLLDQKSAILHLISRKKTENEVYETEINKKSGAKIKVNRYIYPGVTIKINNRKFVVQSEMLNKTFAISKDDDSIVYF